MGERGKGVVAPTTPCKNVKSISIQKSQMRINELPFTLTICVTFIFVIIMVMIDLCKLNVL